MKLKIIILAYFIAFVLWLMGLFPRSLAIDLIFYSTIAIIVIIFLIGAFAGGAGRDLERINREHRQANERINREHEISEIRNTLNEINKKL